MEYCAVNAQKAVLDAEAKVVFNAIKMGNICWMDNANSVQLLIIQKIAFSVQGPIKSVLNAKIN